MDNRSINITQNGIANIDFTQTDCRTLVNLASRYAVIFFALNIV